MRPVNLTAFTIMVALCLTWAFQQVAIKLALPEMGPLTQGAIRNTGAFILIGLYILTRASNWVKGLTLPGLICGLLFGAEFLLIYEALTITDAGRTVMFIYTSPIVVAIGEHFRVGGDRLDAKAWLGVALAFIGVVTALGPGTSPNELAWLGDLMSLAAGIAWGATTLTIKASRLRTAPASQVLIYQLGVAAILFLLVVPFSQETPALPQQTVTIAAILFQTVWVASISYGIWFAMISVYSATTLSVITFITPLFGVAMGIYFLDEPLLLTHMIAVVAVALGILLVSLPRHSGK